MILFAPGLDGLNYLNPQVAHDQKIHAVYGEMGLLQFLEVQLGLLVNENREGTSYLRYLEVLGKNSKNSFFEKSLKVDGLGTAKKLFQERERLILNGWDQKQTGSPRIDALAEVETQFIDEDSYPIRVKRVRDGLQAKPLVKFIPDIQVRSPLLALEKLWRDIFELLEKNNVKVTYFSENQAPSVKNKIQVMRAVNYRESAQWLGHTVAKLSAENKSVVFVCPPNLKKDLISGLNQAQVRWTSDHVVASTASAELSSFVGLLSLVGEDRSPQNLLSWLRMPISPIGWRKAWALAAALQRDENIENFNFNPMDTEDAGDTEVKLTENTPSKKNESEAVIQLEKYFLDLILNPKIEMKQGLEISGLKEISLNYLSWLKETKRLGLKSAASAYSLISSFLVNLADYPENTISEHRLSQFVQTSFQAGAVESEFEAKSSTVCIVDDPKRVLSPVDYLFWFGYNSSSTTPLERIFWSATEIKALEKRNIHFPQGTDLSTAKVYEWLQALKHPDNTFLIVFNTNYEGETDYIHPSFNFMGPGEEKERASWLAKHEVHFKDSDLFATLKFDLITPRDFFKAKATWTIPPSLLPETMRWSFSGVEKIMKCPLAWHLESQKCLNAGTDDRLNQENMALGIMGHKFFELLFHTNYDAKKTFHESTAKDLLSKCLAEVQSLKLWEDYELTHLKVRLLNSARSFHGFLSSNSLEVLSNESSLEKIYTKDITLNGKIDIVLGKGKNPLMVIDFKTNVGPQLVESLKEGSVQLSFYLELLGKPKIAVGYFDLTTGNLSYTGPGGFNNAQSLKSVAESTSVIVGNIMESMSAQKAKINEGLLLAKINPDEDDKYKPYCDGCSYCGICGKKFEQEIKYGH
jgi:hypothetical protein